MNEQDPVPNTKVLQAENLAIGQKFKAIREIFGVSQRELAKRAGVTNSSISMVEQGLVSPSVYSLGRLLAALGLSLEDFFTWLPLVTPPTLTIQPTALTNQPDTEGVSAFRLMNSDTSGFGFPDLWRLAPSAEIPFKLAAQGGIQGWIAEGVVELRVNQFRIELSVGDGFYVPSKALFRLRNLSDVDFSLLLIGSGSR